MQFRVLALSSAAFLLPVSNASGETPSKQATAFGTRESVIDASLSPDGSKIALVTSVNGRGAALQVASLDGKGALRPILRSTGDPDRLSHCQWSTSTRLLCSIYMIEPRGTLLLAYTRMVAVDADGSHLQQVSARRSGIGQGDTQFGGAVLDRLPDDADSAVLMERDFVPQGTTGSILSNNRAGLGVERIDTLTLKRSVVEPPHPSATEFLTDGHGNVRIMAEQPPRNSGYTGSEIRYSYRLAADRKWIDFSNVTIASNGSLTGMRPIAVDSQANAAYCLSGNDGHTALFKVALDGSMKTELVFARPDADVDDVVRFGPDQRVVGATYATDRYRKHFFDPALDQLAAQLSKALPGLPLVTILDSSRDGSKLLLFAGGDTDPGHYYLLDRSTMKLAEIAPERPQLAGMKLAAVQSIRFPAGDGTEIPAYLTLPPGSSGKGLPTIVMPHGGPASRDSWGFDWLAQFFAARGYAVLQPNYRGSTGYGEKWFQDNGFHSWKTAIGDINDAGRWLVQSGIAARDKLAIVGWSYGGYAALQTSVLDPGLFKAIVAVAPVTDLEMLVEEHRDFTNYEIVRAQVGQGPHLSEASPARNAGRIKAPVLLFHGDRDLNVSVAESRKMQDALRDAGGTVEYVEFAGLDHQLEDDGARARLLDQSDRFLRHALALPAAP